jgi:hypothetical protein
MCTPHSWAVLLAIQTLVFGLVFAISAAGGGFAAFLAVTAAALLALATLFRLTVGLNCGTGSFFVVFGIFYQLLEEGEIIGYGVGGCSLGFGLRSFFQWAYTVNCCEMLEDCDQ